MHLKFTSNIRLLFIAAVTGIVMALLFTRMPIIFDIFGLILACSFWLMQKSVGVFNLRQLTIPAFTYWVYVGSVAIPSLFVYEDQRDPYRITFLFAVESALLTIPLGIVFANAIFRFRRRETTDFFHAPMQYGPSDPGPEVYVLFLAAAWLITVLYVLEVHTVPLFYLISHPGEYENLSRLREESLKLLNSPFQYVYSVLGSAGYLLLIILSFGRYLQTKRRLWGVLFVASFITGELYEGFTIAKGPVAVVCVVLCLYFYLYQRGRVGVKFVLLVLASALAFPLYVEVQEYATPQNSYFASAVQGISHRLFYVPAEVLYYHFEVFPNVVPYQHGRTIGPVAIVMGEQVFDASNVVGRYWRPSAPYSITANAPFLGNLNADFGIAGVLIGGFLAGTMLQGTQVYICRRGRSVLTMAIFAILLYQFSDLTATALPTVMLSHGPIFVVLLAWMMTTLEAMIGRALRIHRSRHAGQPLLSPP